MSVSFVSLWMSMGIFAKGIVVLLAVMSVASCATAVERLLALRTAEGRVDGLLPTWRAVLDAGLAPDDRREAFDRSVRATILETASGLRRGFGVLATVGATAPFVGLVGTVLGIVNAFAELASADHGGVGQVSAGIAEALVTTAFGIGVAIPAVWAYNYLSQRVARLVTRIECRAQALAVETLRRGA
jgi:biopolymer transport protein ExbB/TolQ